jgi:signal transduction histidine kinase
MGASAARRVMATTRPADWLVTASLLLLAWFEIWVEPIFQTGLPGPRLPLTLLAVVAVVPLLARRVFPLAALSLMCLGLVGVAVVGDRDQSTFVLFLGLFVATYSVGAYAPPRRALAGAAVVVLASVAFEITVQGSLVDAAVPFFFLAGAWIVGRQMHHQGQRTAELADRAALLARTNALEVQAAIAAERNRIARELHDVVAHAISVMGIQAGAARRTLTPGQDAQREALLDVERLGREALVEMQRMLGALRTGVDDHGVGPLPGLGQVPGLVADARLAGVEVDLDVAGDLEGLPPGLQLTAFRIAQEALTNVRKHARATCVQVRIARCGERLQLTVSDDGTGVIGEPRAGNGLLGMRERVAINKGTLYAGPGDERGFVVRAELPVQA